MREKQHSNNFSVHIFCKVPKYSVDLYKHSQFFVRRALKYGLINDWLFIKNYYGIEKKLRKLEPRGLSYIATIYNTLKKEFHERNEWLLLKAKNMVQMEI